VTESPTHTTAKEVLFSSKPGPPEWGKKRKGNSSRRIRASSLSLRRGRGGNHRHPAEEPREATSYPGRKHKRYLTQQGKEKGAGVPSAKKTGKRKGGALQRK